MFPRSQFGPVDTSIALFELPGPIADDVPFEMLHCIEWAKTQPRADVGMRNYLQSCGFVPGSHRITETDYEIIRCAFDWFHRTAPRIWEPSPLSAFILPIERGGFWVRLPGHRQTRGKPSELLLSTLAEAGWIYKPSPENTYFEVIERSDGKRVLIAKYQSIIGSRIIAEIIGEV